MEKKLFAFLIPVCIISFICFGITVIMLGRSGSETATSITGPSEFINEQDFVGENEWEIDPSELMEFNLAGIDASITSYDGSKVIVRTICEKNRSVDVKLSREDYNQRTIIELHPNNISFSDSGFGVVNWLEDIFSGDTGIRAEIKMPELIYENFVLNQGTGKTTINNLNARGNQITIGSGSIKMNCNPNFRSDLFVLQLGSGEADIDGVKTDRYDFDIGSGNFKITGLAGSGSISMGSGEGTIVYSELNHGEVDMGSGKLNIAIPETAFAVFNLDIATGSAVFNTAQHRAAYGMGTRQVTVGNPGSEINYNIRLMSGSVNILNELPESTAVASVSETEPVSGVVIASRIEETAVQQT